MAYEINVSKNGEHHFATAERSIGYSEKKLREIHDKFLIAFPESEGYKISVTNWEKRGQSVNMNEYLKS